MPLWLPSSCSEMQKTAVAANEVKSAHQKGQTESPEVAGGVGRGGGWMEGREEPCHLWRLGTHCSWPRKKGPQALTSVSVSLEFHESLQRQAENAKSGRKGWGGN